MAQMARSKYTMRSYDKACLRVVCQMVIIMQGVHIDPLILTF